ncbi:MAG TPA: tRNA (adenosine(37)-N6)-dimethylallyltransferase MiaA [Bryobacteraceae bacterium]|nr:tRNA (adenosine(37)-N6)-dimethylallyltransferase MiaA [Bryobacteraceae bacterium]
MPVILGPTGSGKSELALRIARDLQAEVVSCDSVQVYRRFNIGTAKIPESKRGGVPHHLIDIVEPGELFTAGDYAREAAVVLRQIAGRGSIPVLAGGTGFYLRALLEGLSPGPVRDEAVRADLMNREQRRPGSLHRILKRLDATAAKRIHPNDLNKTLRALEIRLLERRPSAELFAAGRLALCGFHPIKIGLTPPRHLLYRSLDERTAAMFEHGLIHEVRELIASGVPSNAKPFESLGYKQALQALRGELNEQQAIESAQRETRRYAKRQLTWFRRETGVHWLAQFGDAPGSAEQALQIINAETKSFESNISDDVL